MKITLIVITIALVFGGFLYLGTGILGEKQLNSISQDIKIETDEELTYVTISRVTLQKPGYVAIREFVDGQVGQMIEVSEYLEAGTHEDIHIDVSYVEGDVENGIALLYLDGGDQGFNAIGSEIAPVTEVQPAARLIRTGEYVSAESLGALSQNFSTTNNIDVAQEVVYTDDGFIPETVTIRSGETVRFINESSVGMWVASDEHPQHTILSTFDQFGIAENGESYDYTFEKSGSWAYHDHIDASKLGTIIVN